MSHYVDTPIGVDPITKQDIVDSKEEMNHEEYLAMRELVWNEIAPAYAPFKPDSHTVHLIAMKRLKEKYP